MISHVTLERSATAISSKKVLFNIFENSPQAAMIEPMPRLDRQAHGTSVPMRVYQSRREEQGSFFHEHASGRGWVGHLRQQRQATLIDDCVMHAVLIADGPIRRAGKT